MAWVAEWLADSWSHEANGPRASREIVRAEEPTGETPGLDGETCGPSDPLGRKYAADPDGQAERTNRGEGAV